MKSLSPSSSFSHRSSFFNFYLVTLSFILWVAILYGEDFTDFLKQSALLLQQEAESDIGQPKLSQEKEDNVAFAVGRTEKGCNVFDGSWIYDEVSRPQYEESECPYIKPQQTCQAHGRPDKGYQHWRWQPHGCSLPSLNASFMLENLRGKRMLFVGDSLNRGQFISMVCLLQRAIPEGAKSMETNNSLTIFRSMEYNTTIEFYWAPFLAESNSDNAIVHRVTDRIVRGTSVNKHARHWKGADIIVFNSYLWWMTGMKMKILRGSFKGEMKNITEMETEDAYRVVLRRVARWVEKNMDPRTTRTFFTSMSPLHERSKEWGGDPEGNCYNETSPITDQSYWGAGSSKTMMKVLNEVFGNSKVGIVSVLNITQLSEYRKDAHSSIHKEFWNKLTPVQLMNPRSYADCVHWCLPGLPDTWNELLYVKLFFP